MRPFRCSDARSSDAVRGTLLEARARLLDVRHGILTANPDPAPDDEGIVLPISDRSRALTAMIDEHLRQIEAALARLDSGAYGICAECGEPIPPRRLQALPVATLCVPCQSAADRRPGHWGVARAKRPGHQSEGETRRCSTARRPSDGESA